MSELASLRQADTLIPLPPSMLGAGQKGPQSERSRAFLSPPPGGYMMPPALREEIHFLSVRDGCRSELNRSQVGSAADFEKPVSAAKNPATIPVPAAPAG